MVLLENVEQLEKKSQNTRHLTFIYSFIQSRKNTFSMYTQINN